MTAPIRVRHLVGNGLADLSEKEWAAYQKTPLKDVYEVLEGNEDCLTCGSPEEEPAPSGRKSRKNQDEQETPSNEENEA